MRQTKTLSEAHYESLLAGMRNVRNRLLFFALFLIYAFLSVLATTDKMLYMQEAISMPLLNIKLPLVAFYIVIPLFVVVLEFNLLYVMYRYKELLLKTNKKYKKDIESLPFGLYEGALLKKDFLNKTIKIVLYFLIFISPIITLFAFYFRFADYQSTAISLYHLILLFLAIGFIFIYKGLFNKEKNKTYFKLALNIIGGVIVSTFIIFLFWYHFFIFYPIAKEDINITKLDYLKGMSWEIENKFNIINKENWFLPRITIYSEILIPYNKELLELLKEEKKDINSSLLHYTLPFFQEKRNLRLAIFNRCIMINTNFIEANLEKADFSDSNLDGANLEEARLQRAYLIGVQLQGADLREAQLQGANLEEAQLQGAYLRETQLQGAYLRKAQLQRAYLWITQLQGTDLREAQLQGADLEEAQLQGANLRKAQLQGADLIGAQLQGANLEETQLQGANIENLNLTGAILEKTNFKGVTCQYIKFTKLEGQNSDFRCLNKDKLSQKEFIEIIKYIKKWLKNKENIQAYKNTLSQALNKNSYQWLKQNNKDKIITGPLSKGDILEVKKELEENIKDFKRGVKRAWFLKIAKLYIISLKLKV